MASDQLDVGGACTSACKRVLDECLRFSAADLYLVKIEGMAIREVGEVRDAHDALVKALRPEYESPSSYFMGRSFILLVAAFEYFLQDLLTTIILIYPKKLGHVTFKLSEIVDATVPDELVWRAIEATLNKIMYEKPRHLTT